MEDEEVLRKASAEDWILLTNDKGFGDKVFLGRHPYKGVVLFRLADERSINKIEIVRRFLERYADQLAGRFVTVTETQVRFARDPQG